LFGRFRGFARGWDRDALRGSRLASTSRKRETTGSQAMVEAKSTLSAILATLLLLGGKWHLDGFPRALVTP